MRARTWLGATAGVVGLTLLFAVVFEISVERALLLAPAIVIGGGALAGFALIFGRAALEALRRR